ncbi:hypothetical protein ScPMuIL_018015 [Solemya velum]
MVRMKELCIVLAVLMIDVATVRCYNPNNGRSLQHVHVVGNNYQVGFQIGRLFKPEIQNLIKGYDYYHSLETFYNTTEGRVAFERFLEQVKEHYPMYKRELEGLAAGAGVSFAQVFILNIEPEYAILMHGHSDNFQVEFGASSRFSSGDIFDARNETEFIHITDVPSELRGSGFILSATVLSNNASWKNEKFTTFVIPGFLPGSTWSYSQGTIRTVNGLFPKKINRAGIPRYFVTRALLAVSDIGAVNRIIASEPGVASGFSFMQISKKYKNVFSYYGYSRHTELEAYTYRRVTEVHGNEIQVQTTDFYPESFYFHFNMYQNTANISQFTDMETIYKQACISQYLYKELELHNLFMCPGNPSYERIRGEGAYITDNIVVFKPSEGVADIYAAGPFWGEKMLSLQMPLTD